MTRKVKRCDTTCRLVFIILAGFDFWWDGGEGGGCLYACVCGGGGGVLSLCKAVVA